MQSLFPRELNFRRAGFPRGPVVKTVLPLQGSLVQSPVLELRPHMPQRCVCVGGGAKNKN